MTPTHLAQIESQGAADEKRCCEEGTSVLKMCNALKTSLALGQIRSTAMDLRRASGTDYSQSRQALPEASFHAVEG
jgi:hypothetical protein